MRSKSYNISENTAAFHQKLQILHYKTLVIYCNLRFYEYRCNHQRAVAIGFIPHSCTGLKICFPPLHSRPEICPQLSMLFLQLIQVEERGLQLTVAVTQGQMHCGSPGNLYSKRDSSTLQPTDISTTKLNVGAQRAPG